MRRVAGPGPAERSPQLVYGLVRERLLRSSVITSEYGNTAIAWKHLAKESDLYLRKHWEAALDPFRIEI